MDKLQRVEILGVSISVVNFQSAINYVFDNLDEARGQYICAANVHTTVTAHEDENYKMVQNGSFLTLPDGKPLSFVGKKYGFREMDRVTGPDFLEEVLRRTESTKIRHYFYGTTKENLEAFVKKIKELYPDLKIAGYQPSLFRPLSSEEEAELIDKINSSGADFVWVALGAPRQEHFCQKLAARTSAVWTAVGGAFNVISGAIPRAPQWLQDHGLEWFYRFSKEPRRLFKRYFVTNTKFIWYLLKDKRRAMKQRICMIVPSFRAKGGITAVVSGYKNSPLERDYDIKYIETYCDGNRIEKALMVVRAYLLYISTLVCWRPSIIHIHSSFGGSFYRKLPFVLLANWFHKPIINHIHGADFGQFYLRASKRKKALIRYFYAKCTKLIALSDEWKENLKQIVKEDKIVIVENYSVLNTEAIKNRKKKTNQHVVLFLGFICSRKGCYDIPAVVEKVVNEVPDAHFILAGTGDIEQIQAITPTHIKDNIIYPGWVRDEKKDSLLKEADLFFLPSYNEGMPMSILDAMGYGLPIVSTTVGGITKIVHNGKNGYVCQPGDINQLATSIIELLQNDNELKRKSEESIRIIQQGYSLQLHIDRLKKAYADIC